MAKMSDFEMAKAALAEMITEKNEIEAQLKMQCLKIRGLQELLWTMDESKDDDGNPAKVIDLGEFRTERRVTPVYDEILFEGDCSPEFEKLRKARSQKAYDDYTPTNSDMEAVYRTRPDGEELRKAHKIGDKIVFAIAKNAN